MKKVLKLLIVLLMIPAILSITSCGDKDSTSKNVITEEGKLDLSNIKFEDKTFTYDGKKHKLEIEGELPAGITVSYSDNILTDVGEKVVTAHFTVSNNYNEIPDMTAKLSVIKADFDVKFNNKSFVYDGTEKNLEIEGTLPKGITVTYENNGLTNVGEKVVTAHFTVSNNYNEIPDMTAKLSVIKADFDVKFNNKSFVYDGTEKSLEIEGTLPDGCTVEYSGNGMINAGTYEVTATVKDSSGNHNDLVKKATLTINKAHFDGVEFTDDVYQYDGNSHTYKSDVSLPVGLRASYSDNSLTIPGKEKITIWLYDDNDNYDNVSSKEEYASVYLCVYYIVDGISYIISDDKAIVYEVDKNIETANILNSIKIGDINYDVVSIDTNAFSGCTNLKNIVVGNGITNLYSGIFKDCSSLESITLPFIGESATKNQYLGYIFGASSYSENSGYVPTTLKELIISDSCTYIGSYAFYKCSSLTSITIGNGVTSIGSSAFYNCSSLETITLPFIGESATSNTYLGYIFGASSYFYNSNYVPTTLKELIISNRCTRISSYAFYKCSSLTSIIIPNSVTSIGADAFGGCDNCTIYYDGTKEQWDNISGSSSIISKVYFKED